MKVNISNFQSLKDVEFEVKGLTVITGLNNTGKSACARALSGLFSNPRGSSHVRVGEDFSTVRVKFDDAPEIEWSKGKKKNSYKVGDKLIDKVGTSVPDEVRSLGVVPVKVAGKEVWPQVSKQFEQIFLLDLPPSTLSSALSNVDLVQTLEKASDIARSNVRKAKNKLNTRREDLDLEKSQILDYEGYEELKEHIERIMFLEDKVQEFKDRLDKMSRVRKKRKEYLDLISSISEAEEATIPEVDSKKGADLKDLSDLQRLRNNYFLTTMIIGVGLESYPSYPEGVVSDSINKLNSINNKRKEMKLRIESISPLVDMELPEICSDDNLKVAEQRREEQIRASHFEYDIQNTQSELEALMASIGETCPLCNHKIDH